ncbi:hypothetical protein HHI36_000174 [Cryptolaemus montrouzieri]|uniref:Uncharacterized protein n=1 Tax=Cryptolaemus montrouzieri TaxID=559131 RepID=A0ABD2P4I1_9CUCU
MGDFKLIILLISLSYLCFTTANYTLDQLTGIWIVRNSSVSNGPCPFFHAKAGPGNAYLTLEYRDGGKNDSFNLTASQTTAHELRKSNETIGAVVFLKENVTHYVLLSFNIEGDIPQYLLLTRKYNLSKEMNDDILKFWNSTATRNVTLSPANVGTPDCQKFVSMYVSEMGGSTNSTMPSGAAKPPMNGITTKPQEKPTNNGAGYFAPDLALTVILIYITFTCETFNWYEF